MTQTLKTFEIFCKTWSSNCLSDASSFAGHQVCVVAVPSSIEYATQHGVYRIDKQVIHELALTVIHEILHHTLE